MPFGGDPIGPAPFDYGQHDFPVRHSLFRFVSGPVKRKNREIEQVLEPLLVQLGAIRIPIPDQVEYDATEKEVVADLVYLNLSIPEREIEPVTTENSRVLQGKLEKSNVNPVRAMVQMIEMNRNFEALQKAVHAQNETLRQATNEIAK